MNKPKYYYLKIRFKDYYQGRKIYYMNDCYVCDCINEPFTSKEECLDCIPEIRYKYGERIESITLHYTR